MTAKRSSHSIESGRPDSPVFIYYDSANGEADGDVAPKREMGSIRCQSWSRTICQRDKWPGHIVCMCPSTVLARTPQHPSILLSESCLLHAACCLLPGPLSQRILWRFGQENQNLVLDHRRIGGHQSGQDVLLSRPRVVHQGQFLATNDKCIYFPLSSPVIRIRTWIKNSAVCVCVPGKYFIMFVFALYKWGFH